MEEACSLCGREFPHYTLRRCSRCRRLYCGDCIIFTWDRDVYRHATICLNCARRRVSPRKFSGKYTPLSAYLARRARYTSVVTLSLAKLEEILGADLPSSAFGSQQWWTNTRNTVQGQSWLDVGWEMDTANLEARTVTFKRAISIAGAGVQKVRDLRRGSPEWRKRAPKRPMVRGRKIPSKTRIAKAMARFNNIQRKKATIRQYRGRFKPKPAFEKRLYKPDAKPD